MNLFKKISVVVNWVRVIAAGFEAAKNEAAELGLIDRDEKNEVINEK